MAAHPPDRLDPAKLDPAKLDPAGPGAVGRVLGTEDATPLSFWVAIAPEQYLQLDDVVVCEREVPGREGSVRLSGVVTQVRARHEGARFDSDVFLIEAGQLPAEAVESAEVLTTRVEPEVFVPPTPGTAVHRASGEARDHALFFDQMARKLPIGLGRDGRPLFANLEFLDGTRGAHVNISGISGVATKTTYATFLLYSVFNSGVLDDEATNTRALIFNVKGEDLLFLDHDNIELSDSDRDKYRDLGMTAGAFKSVTVFAPPRKGDANARPDVANRTLGVHAFYWTLADFVTEELLPFAFADAEDDRQQYTMVVHNVAAALKRDGVAAADGGWRIDGHTLRTYRDLVDFVISKVQNDDDLERRDWAGPATGTGTVNAFVRRLLTSQRALAQLVRADIPETDRHRIDTDDAQVTVVDLHNLPDRAKRFVVGVTLRTAFDRKEQSGTARLAAVRRARRVEQVRTSRRRLSHQGDPPRRRRARSLDGHRPRRRAADRERGGAPDHLQLVDPGRGSARSRGGGPARVRLLAHHAPKACDDREAGDDVRDAT